VPAEDLYRKIDHRDHRSPWVFQIFYRPLPFAQHPIVLLDQSMTRSLKGSLLERRYPGSRCKNLSSPWT
jgi:hypothetical protein